MQQHTPASVGVFFVYGKGVISDAPAANFQVMPRPQRGQG